MVTAAASTKRHAITAAASLYGLGWRPALVLVCVLYALILLAYRDTAMSLIGLWGSSNLYSHGFLVLPAAIFLLWRRRDALRSLEPRPSLLGPGMLGLSALIWLLGEVSSTNLLQHFGLVSMLPGIFVSVLGLRIARASLLPLAYVMFAVPFGGELIPALQQLTGSAVASILLLSGIPVFLEAQFLVIPNGRFEIAEACAGVRSLIATVAASAFGSDLLYNRVGKRLVFICFAIAFAIVGNAVRAYLIVALSAWQGLEASIRFDHVTFGLVFLTVILVLIFATGVIFRDVDGAMSVRGPHWRRGAGQSGLLRTTVVCAAALAAAVPLQLAGQMNGSAVVPPDLGARPPDVPATWRHDPTATPDWRPDIANPDAELLQTFVSNAGPVTLHVAYFSYQRAGAELVQDVNRYAGQEPWQEMATFQIPLDAPRLQVPCSIISSGVEDRVSCHVFWVNDQLTGNVVTAKLRQALARFAFNTPAAAVISVSWAQAPDRITEEALTSSLSQALPAISRWLTVIDRAE